MKIQLNIDDLKSQIEPILQFHRGNYNSYKHGSALRNNKKSLHEGVEKIKDLFDHLNRLIEIENINDLK